MNKNKLVMIACITASLLSPALVRASVIQVEVGDRPYYNHGARYWAGDYEMVWVPGHMSRYGHHWVHGHYARTEHRRHNWNGHHEEYNDNDRR